MAGPDRRAQHRLDPRAGLQRRLELFALFGFGAGGDLLLDLAQFGAGAGEMDLGPDAGGPACHEFFERVAQVEPLGIEAPEMLIVEDQADAGARVNPQHVGRREADVVVFKDETAANMLGALLPPRDPAGAAGLVIVIDAADMGDHHRFVVQLHTVEHFGLAGQIPDALRGQRRIGGVEQHILRGVEGQAHVERARLGAERAQLRVAFRDHVVELRHVGVRGVGRKVRREAVHVDLLGRQIVENGVDIFERAFEMRIFLPAPGVVGFHPRLAHDLDGEAEA